MATGNALNIQGCLRGGEAWDYLSRWSLYADCSETMNCNFQSCEWLRKVDQTHLRHVGQFSFTCRTISIHSRAVMAAVDHFSTCYKAPLQHTLSVNILLGLDASLVIPKMCVSSSMLLNLSSYHFSYPRWQHVTPKSDPSPKTGHLGKTHIHWHLEVALPDIRLGPHNIS